MFLAIFGEKFQKIVKWALWSCWGENLAARKHFCRKSLKQNISLFLKLVEAFTHPLAYLAAFLSFHTKCILEFALIYLHSIYFSFKNYFEDCKYSYVWGSSFFASARLHHKFWIHSPNITNVAWFQSLESRRSCPGPQDSCRQRLHWQFFSGQFISMRGPRMIRPWKIRIQRRFSRKYFYIGRGTIFISTSSRTFSLSLTENLEAGGCN